jgi:hypothetical protein
MNYFAHAYPHLADETLDAYFLAGLATPDWLSVVARRSKCRTRHVEPWIEHADPRLAALARGIAQHHADDRWFHETRAFAELSLLFAKRIQQHCGDGGDMRPSFLGHILVELLLDAELIARDPRRLDRYYAAIDRVDAVQVAAWVEQMSGRPVDELALFIPRFVTLRFLADYANDGGLCFRVNQVLHRVGLPELPFSFGELLPSLRGTVAQNAQALMAASTATLRCTSRRRRLGDT